MEVKTDKLHIAVVGRANVGKSLLIECIFYQKDFKPDDVNRTARKSIDKSVRLFPDDSTVKIETIVIDDKEDFELKSRSGIVKAICMADFTIMVLDAREELFESETELITTIQKSQVPFLIAVNKIEFGTNPNLLTELDALEVTYFELSCKENAGIENFRKKLVHLLPGKK